MVLEESQVKIQLTVLERVTGFSKSHMVLKESQGLIQVTVSERVTGFVLEE